MTIRKRRRVLTSPEDVAEHIDSNDYPASAPWEEWFEETAYYVEKLAGTRDFGFICRTANAAGTGLGDWFKKRLAPQRHRAEPVARFSTNGARNGSRYWTNDK